MEIRTKFDVGDSVWGILRGRAHGFEIKGINISRDANGNMIVNYIDDKYNSYPEHQCFLAKEELRDYFMGGE